MTIYKDYTIMRVTRNKQLPEFSIIMADENKCLGDSESQMSDEPIILKPQVIRPRPVPHISLFASPEARKALECINGESDEEKEQEQDLNNNESDDKEDSDEKSDDTSDTSSNQTDSSVQSRYRWRIVASAVSGSPRALKVVNKDSGDPSPSLGPEDFAKKRGRRASVCLVSSGSPSLTPVPPSTPRQRRMSLSPSRYPLLPNRLQAVSPFSPKIVLKTSSDTNLNDQDKISPSGDDQSSPPLSSSPPKIDVTGGNPLLARALSRRRLSLPVSPRTHLIPPRPPSPSRLRSPSSEGASPANSTGTASPTPSVLSNSSHGSGSGSCSKRYSATSTLQANRERLESLLKQRSKVIANLTVGSNRSRDSPGSPLPIRSKHSLPRPVLSSGSPSTPDLSSDSSTPELPQTVRSLDDEPNKRAVLGEADDRVNDEANNDITTVKSGTTALTTRSLDDSFLSRAITQQRPIFRRRGAHSLDSGISLGNISVAELDSSASTAGDPDTEPLPAMSRLRCRRGTICMGTLNSLLTSKPDERGLDQQALESSKASQRSDNDIANEVEDELQRRICKRKSQLLIQAAPGSNSLGSAVARLEARANCKTTNGRLRKIMNNLTMERTTSELLTMKSAVMSFNKKHNAEELKRAKSLDYEQ